MTPLQYFFMKDYNLYNTNTKFSRADKIKKKKMLQFKLIMKIVRFFHIYLLMK